MPQELFDRPQYSLLAAEKSRLLLSELNSLTGHHLERCSEYRRLSDVLHPGRVEAAKLDEVPYLPVSLFKTHRLVSVPNAEVFKELASSGTTGQQVSRVFLDRETAHRQSVALMKIMTCVLGPKRLPMVILDSESVVRDRKGLSARGAGILGMITFGHSHFHGLDDGMDLDVEGIERFLVRFGHAPFLMFGFTFVVWKCFYQRIVARGLDCSKGILIHSGGWKKLQREAISNDEFKRALREACGISRIYNFYGMAEQVGSVFMEGDDGFLYTPNFADVIVRDPVTWEEAPIGTPGVVQVLSVLPLSYPGHSLLTEDLGVVHGIDDSPIGRRGKYFSVIGRVPNAELRGCSDTQNLVTAGSR